MEDTRTRILEATSRILTRDGGDAVTIAAVAKETGISKGGLFYHFASKDLLIEGLIQHYIAGFDELIQTAGPEPGAATRAYLASAFQPATQPIIALLAATITNTTALGTLRYRYEVWQHRLNNDGIPPHIATLIRCTVDGLWLADTFDLAKPNAATRHQILTELEELVN